MQEKMKYIKLKDGEFIFFPLSITHDTFRHLFIRSAGFATIKTNIIAFNNTLTTKSRVICYGESLSLGLTSEETDSGDATSQLFGYEELLKQDENGGK